MNCSDVTVLSGPPKLKGISEFLEAIKPIKLGLLLQISCGSFEILEMTFETHSCFSTRVSCERLPYNFCVNGGFVGDFNKLGFQSGLRKEFLS